ncbi:MAG: hypothetical protein JWO90_1737, partial [Solirubrobacterales bacterium]|nr:hypothetical protein [Solirubrobacterales bacterium]
MTQADGARTLTPFDYIRPVLSRWWIVVLVVAIATGGTYAYYERQPKVFKASTRIYTNLDSAIPNASEASTDVLAASTQNAATLLTSRSTAASVLPKLSFRTTSGDIASSLSAVTAEGSSFITITATRPQAAQAAELANVVAQQYIDSRSTAARRNLERYVSQLQDQIKRLPRTVPNATERASIAASIRSA